MTDRTSYVLLAVATGLLTAAHLAIKPALKQGDVHAMAETFTAGNDWLGRFADNFEMRLRDGTTFRLADHVGREIVVLNFFTTWCVPCREEMPELARYANGRSGPPRILLVGVDVGEYREQVDRFTSQLGITFPIGLDDFGLVARQFGVTAYPTTVVIGANGRIKLYQVGAIRNADAALSQTIEPEAAALADSTRNWNAEYRRAAVGVAPPPRRDGFTPPDANAAVDGLTGRARSIAEAMPCPCGCEKLRVAACSCQTAQAIKARLREGIDPGRSDKEVMEMLNREFCMKGM